ncbi:glycosyltransferase [Terrabacter sp. LjRoot27]|uniref:glycosyltransferase n=1 Tax=Terrabacter sp. LjRoot27 TaxID=3342306 RepID=UPI003F4FBC17
MREPTSPRVLRAGYARLGRIMAAHAGPVGSSTALVTVNPFIAAWSSDGFDRCIYFGRDDWASFPPQEPWWDAYRAAYAAIAASCDHVFVVSQTLAERVAPGFARVIPNGVDVRRWSASHTPSPHLEGMARPVGIYAGTVDERIDLDVISAAGAFLGSIAVAGPCPDAAVGDRLREMPGVRLLGRLGQDELVQAIQSADVGLLPHADTPLTRAMSPLKLYEYLAGGLPVVATDLPPVRGEGPRVFLCPGSDDWPIALRAAISQPRLSESERRRTVDSLSWSSRLQPLLDAVAGV